MGFGGPQQTWPITPAETAAAVTPANTAYATQPYDIRRFGAKLDNVTDDTTALTKALTVASQTAGAALGNAITVPTGVSLLSSTVTLFDRVHVLGINKRGAYFKATGGWANGASAWNSGTAYVVGNYVTLSGILYICTQANTNTTPPNASFWDPISNAMFYANNSFGIGGTGQSMFDSTLQNCSVDCSNINGLGGVLSSAWQEDCGLRGALILNFGSYGVRLQDGFGGASLTKIIDCEIFGGTLTGQTITGITQASKAVVTVSTTGTTNPFTINSYIAFSGISGMTQMNGLTGQIVAVGGSSGAYTATVLINSTAFTAYTSGGLANGLIGIDLTPPIGSVGSFILDVSNTSVTGGTTQIAAGIACNGNSLCCRQIHVEYCVHGVLVDGLGHIKLEEFTGSANQVTNLITIAPNFSGTLRLINCRRNGATNFLNDLRVAQVASFGAITAGSGYTNGTYSQVAMTGGTGIGAKAQITVAGGVVTVVTLQVPGTGYVAGDSLSAAAADIGGTGSGFSVLVATIFTGLGVIGAQDISDLLINSSVSGDTGGTNTSGSTVTIGAPNSGATLALTGITGNNALTLVPQVSGANFAVAVDANSCYLGTTTNKQMNIVINSNNAATFTTTRGLSLVAPTSGASLTLPAGTATIEPLLLSSGVNLTTTAAGVVEYDGTCEYFTPFATNRSIVMTEAVQCISAAYTLTSQTAAQKLLNATTNGAITLPIGVYEFECAFTLTSMSASSGAFGFALGGSSTHTDAWWASADKTATLATAVATALTSYNTAANVAISPSNTSTVGWAMIRGIIRVTVAGTIIPQVSLGVAAAAIVGANSFFRILPVGPSGFTTVGQWT